MADTNSIKTSTDSADKTRKVFDRYFTKALTFPSNDIDAVIGFFESRGFEKSAAISIGSILLEQSRVDNLNVFDLLDRLKKEDKVRLNQLVTAMLNTNRSKISKLGFREETVENKLESRNILY